MDANRILQHYFLENRSRLIDIAAYLDRVGRVDCVEQMNSELKGEASHASMKGGVRGLAIRMAIKKSLQVLLTDEGNRVERIQDILSDPTQEPHESLEQTSGKSAWGASDENRCC